MRTHYGVEVQAKTQINSDVLNLSVRCLNIFIHGISEHLQRKTFACD